MRFLSTKTYTHAQGLSACFRQFKADSHCRFIHGYALQVKLTFDARELDDRNWVQDFGGLKEIKAWLEDRFDHKLCVDIRDPLLPQFQLLEKAGLAQIREFVGGVGCEAFAKHVYEYVSQWLRDQANQGRNIDQLGIASRVYLFEVEVREHEGNSAIVRRE